MSRVIMNDSVKQAEDSGLVYNQNSLTKEAGYQPRLKINGQISMILREKDGTILEERSFPNVIVTVASILVARLFKDNSEPANGAFALALGTGDPSSDPFSPPAATAGQTTLEAEVIRKQFASVNFIDTLGAVSATATNVVDFTTFFSESEAADTPLLEMGLFGGDATLAPNTGTMINYRTFKVINKSSTSTLTITWRLTF